MKSIILVITSFILLPPLYAQVKPHETYAIVSIETNYDKVKRNYWCSIQSESVEKYAKEIKNLVKYGIEKKSVLTGVSFYHERNDSSLVFYNYFLSPTEALQFLADHKWQLIAVNHKMVSDYENVKDGDAKLVPVTKLISTPVYYFKKDIEALHGAH